MPNILDYLRNRAETDQMQEDKAEAYDILMGEEDTE